MKNRPYPYYELVQMRDMKDMVEKRAEENADETAFSWSEGKELKKKTYREYKDDIDALGTYLYSEGVKDTHIAIVAENSYEWLVAFLAILNGGNVAAPVDKELPAERKCELIKQADSTAVFVSSKYKEDVKAAGVREFDIEELGGYIEKGKKLISGGDTSFTSYKVDREKLAAIFFTSGTTGKSKGVMLSQKNIIEDINASCKHFVPSEGDTIAALPFNHSFGLMTTVYCVFNYKKVVYINRSLKSIQKDLQLVKPGTLLVVPLFVETFYKIIRNNVKKKNMEKKLAAGGRISNALLAVGIDKRRSMFKELIDGLGGNLSSIISGGAALDPKYVKAFRTWGIEVLPGYGITECAPVISVNRNEYWRDGSVGPALPGCEVKISDEGEILAKGDNVMMGYYKDEEETAKVIKDGWFHTGDLGYIDKDGFIFITGRAKNLIILSNGENVSPEEIEAALMKDEEAIEEVVVYGEKGKLVAEIFPAEDHLGDQAYFDAVAAKWSKDQPSYKKIQKVVLRDKEFEKNSTKKIIRYKIQ